MAYGIADRSMLNESMIIKTFFAILGLHNSRFRLTEIMRIIESDPIRSSFQLSHEDFELIRKWVKDTRIRWGMDATFREKLGLPGTHENTWQAGVERLLLGYAMLDGEDQLFQGILPYHAIEGSHSNTLEKFLNCLYSLFDCIQSFQRPRTVLNWIQKFEHILDTFFQSSRYEEREVQALRDSLTLLEQNTSKADFFQKISFDIIKNHLTESLSAKSFGTGFISGGVTFSAMLPMRSIPFDVICLLGMNHDAYPRQTRSTEFDLISKHPLKGDRSRRHDDQYLFLESLLSTRKIFYISYIGKSIQDNSSLPSSVLISELLQYIENGYSLNKRSIRTHIVTEHKLQPFHPVYFDASNPDGKETPYFSYSEPDLNGAKSLQGNRIQPDPFFSKDIPTTTPTEIQFQDLRNFFQNPCKYIITKQLGIYLDPDRQQGEDREIFTMNALER